MSVVKLCGFHFGDRLILLTSACCAEIHKYKVFRSQENYIQFSHNGKKQLSTHLACDLMWALPPD